MNTRSRLFLGAALLGAFTAAMLPAPEAFAKAKAESLKGKFGKTGFKASPTVTIVGSYSAGTGLLIINGNSLKVGLGGGKLAWLQMNGLAADPRSATFPITMTNCAGLFSYVKYKGFSVPNQNNAPAWTTSNGLTIVLTGFDPAASRLTGTFTGHMDPGDNNQNGTAIVVAKGKLSIDVLFGP